MQNPWLSPMRKIAWITSDLATPFYGLEPASSNLGKCYPKYMPEVGFHALANPVCATFHVDCENRMPYGFTAATHTQLYIEALMSGPRFLFNKGPFVLRRGRYFVGLWVDLSAWH